METVVSNDNPGVPRQEITQKLLGRVRASVLRVVLGLSSDQTLHLREIARQAQVAPAAAQRELVQLRRLGVVTSESRGMQVFYKVNLADESLRNIVAGLRLLVEYAPTMSELLTRELLQASTPPVLAVLFGKPDDDASIGLLVVGPGSFEDVLASVEPVVREFKPRCGVRLLAYSQAGFVQRQAAGDATITQALGERYATLVNTIDFATLA